VKAIQIKAIISGTSSALLYTFLISCHHLSNQEQLIVVPPAVEKAFKAKYSDIPHTWKRRNYGYEAAFVQNNMKWEAEFSETGEWLESEQYVTEKDFPAAVLNKIKQEYPEFVITKYEIEYTPKGLFYEVDITDGETEAELYFDSSGNPSADLYED
jgi:Putative beta-lactamase-inhibitor-like, PepSY-like